MRARRRVWRPWNDDQTLALVFTDKDESGLYQLVNFDRGVAEILAQPYPDIPPDQVGAVRQVRYAAADGLEIPGYLTLPPGVQTPENLPLIVLAHGGPASRDVAGFDWWAQALASRGYAVLQANFRGSDGYTRAFLEAGYGEWGRKMQTDLSDGVRWLIHGRDDTVVAIEQSRVMAEAMRRAGKPVELIELEGEDHWLSRADTRRRMLRETVRFLEANNPPR